MRSQCVMLFMSALMLGNTGLSRNSEGVAYEQVGQNWVLMHLNEGCEAATANKGVFDSLILRRTRSEGRQLVILIKGDWRGESGEYLWITAMQEPSTKTVLFQRQLLFTRGSWTGAGTYFFVDMPDELYAVLGRTLILSYTNLSTINNSFVIRDVPVALKALEACEPMQAQR